MTLLKKILGVVLCLPFMAFVYYLVFGSFDYLINHWREILLAFSLSTVSGLLLVAGINLIIGDNQ